MGILVSSIRKLVTPTISANVAYAAGDAVGGLLTFDGVFDFDPNKTTPEDLIAVISKLWIIDKSSHAPADLRLLLFKSLLTPTADNSPFLTTNPSIDFVREHYLGSISFPASDWFDGAAVGALSFNEITKIPMMQVTSDDGNLYGQFVTSAATTYSQTNDLIVGMVTEPLARQ